MKNLLIILFVLFSSSLSAQNDFDNNVSQSQREIDLMNFIKSDAQLYEKYKRGENKLARAKTLGYTSLGLIGLNGLIILAAWDASLNDLGTYGGLLIISSAVSLVTGLVAITEQISGKKKIKDVKNQAKRKMGLTNSSFQIKCTSNGAGIVYSF